ncbi:hypothetical protein QR77_33760 [Streptomyces sp. 150FB]|uniref:PrsW family intramembrane metalloprotease n=1 Tax=Streptomyces sp. 150FB TaxID=1576605 RepID=UPI0005890F7C|nr:PrsW family intramembrane metalloprotease [Streptomyces sp. 150FB]KIF79407.1 hypothetical protein QR77_33760 [Streptomyces sp. 150FB]
MRSPAQARSRLTVVGLVVTALGWLATLGWIGRQIGVSGVLIGILCAAVTIVPVLAAFRWVDRWERESPRRLLVAFCWGAGIAAPIAVAVLAGATRLLDATAGHGAIDRWGPMVVTPLSEEGLKGLFVVALLVFRPRRVDGLIDGIVYAGVATAGFAFTENILYLGRAVTEFLGGTLTDRDAIVKVVASLGMRMVLLPFMHPVWTCLIGIGAGIAVASRRVGVRILAVLLGYLAAAGMHALWDTTALRAASPTLLFKIYGFVMVPLFAGLIVLVVLARRRQARTVVAELPGIAEAGWILPDEVPLLADLSRRRGLRAQVRRRSGRAAARAVADHQAAVSRLALLRGRIARGAVRDHAGAEQEERVRAVVWTQERARELSTANAAG